MTLIIILHVFICVFLVAVILLQPGKGDAGIGFGSSSQSIFGSKGAGNFLTRLTAVCAVGYLLVSFVLTYKHLVKLYPEPVVDKVQEEVPVQPTAPQAEAAKTPEPAKPEAKKK